jgi:DNA-directed RNA polymerase subunit M/transcription elongation factor TFIIS
MPPVDGITCLPIEGRTSIDSTLKCKPPNLCRVLYEEHAYFESFHTNHQKRKHDVLKGKASAVRTNISDICTSTTNHDISDSDNDDDDAMDGTARAIVCPKCKGHKTRVITVQKRSRDEASSSFLLCKDPACKFRWFWR